MTNHYAFKGWLRHGGRYRQTILVTATSSVWRLVEDLLGSGVSWSATTDYTPAVMCWHLKAMINRGVLQDLYSDAVHFGPGKINYLPGWRMADRA